VGGRVHSWQPDNDDNIWVALGGQWVHEASVKNPLWNIINEELGIGFQQLSKTQPFGQRRSNIVFDYQTGQEIQYCMGF
jgi:hypothetical protein